MTDRCPSAELQEAIGELILAARIVAGKTRIRTSEPAPATLLRDRLRAAAEKAETLCRIYFEIASEAVGEGEVNRQREKRISAELAKEKP